MNGEIMQTGKYRVGVVVATCALLIGLVATFLTVKSVRGTRAVTRTVADFLAAIEEKDYTSAYEHIGQEWESRTTFDEFHRLHSEIRKRLGVHQDLSLNTINVAKRSGHPTVINAIYDVRYGVGEVKLIVSLSRQNGSYRMIGAFFDTGTLRLGESDQT